MPSNVWNLVLVFLERLGAAFMCLFDAYDLSSTTILVLFWDNPAPIFSDIHGEHNEHELHHEV